MLQGDIEGDIVTLVTLLIIAATLLAATMLLHDMAMMRGYIRDAIRDYCWLRERRHTCHCY